MNVTVALLSSREAVCWVALGLRIWFQVLFPLVLQLLLELQALSSPPLQYRNIQVYQCYIFKFQL